MGRVKDSIKVRYHNDMTTIEHGLLNSKEQDVFFYICSRVREHGTKEVKMSYISIREGARLGKRANSEILKIIQSIWEKMASFNYVMIETDSRAFCGTIFSVWDTDKTDWTLTVKMNVETLYLLNCLDGQFTEWEMAEFLSLRSMYEKRLYRLIAQWKHIGITRRYSIDEIIDLLGISIPDPARRGETVIRVIDTAVIANARYFYGLRPIYTKARTKGAPITHVAFTFQAKLLASLWKE